MKTTIDIPNKLLEEAMELTGSQNRNQMIIEALKNEIIRIKRKRLIALKGTVDLGIDLDSLRDRK
jgi:metal-responsive CopG/Arc/MetJ family transcriptional regulator